VHRDALSAVHSFDTLAIGRVRLLLGYSPIVARSAPYRVRSNVYGPSASGPVLVMWLQPTSAWTMMDRVVLRSLIAHDKTLGVLDELSTVRARLQAIFDAIEAGDADLSERAMDTHISDAWQRRRPADHRGTKSRRKLVGPGRTTAAAPRSGIRPR
jgi:hypothetical protein